MSTWSHDSHAMYKTAYIAAVRTAPTPTPPSASCTPRPMLAHVAHMFSHDALDHSFHADLPVGHVGQHEAGLIGAPNLVASLARGSRRGRRCREEGAGREGEREGRAEAARGAPIAPGAWRQVPHHERAQNWHRMKANETICTLRKKTDHRVPASVTTYTREAVARSGAAMSRHCLAGPTKKELDPMESRLPKVYLEGGGGRSVMRP
eukprot:scaffold11125_cov84-Isochrysis_galbana.AAC.1